MAIALLFFTGACASSTSCSQSLKKMLKKTDAQHLQRRAFIGLSSTRFFTRCFGTACGIARVRYLASAFIIGKNANDPSMAYVITAKHFCDHRKDIENKMTISQSFVATDIDYRDHTAYFLYEHPKLDVCIMVIDGAEDLPALEFANDMPNMGERVFNMAAPTGLFGKSLVPIFEGFLIGHAPDNLIPGCENTCVVYSTPLVGGSSGSPVLNLDGEVVSMQIAGLTDFNHVGFAIPLKGLLETLESIDLTEDLGKKGMTPKISDTSSVSKSNELIIEIPIRLRTFD